MKATKPFTKIEKCRERTNYVLGYTLPKFTQEEWDLRNKLEHYESWTPHKRYWSGNPNDDFYTIPQPEKPILSVELKERLKMYNEWVKLFNTYCEKLV